MILKHKHKKYKKLLINWSKSNNKIPSFKAKIINYKKILNIIKISWMKT